MKHYYIAFFVILFLVFSSCSKTKQEKPVAQIQENQIASEATKIETKIDYDLSEMNYNMLSAITFEMLVEPEKYINKTVKMSGQFYSEIYEEKRYYTVVVWDATKCCPAGMDFIPPQGFNFPKDFPEEESTITVTGILHENPDDGNLLFYANTIEF